MIEYFCGRKVKNIFHFADFPKIIFVTNNGISVFCYSTEILVRSKLLKYVVVNNNTVSVLPCRLKNPRNIKEKT